MYRKQLGLSLIELMIALLIGSILLIGLVQVFAASRTAYQLSQGVGRVQENARFAMDYLQRDIRMVGHNGCVNDQGRLQTADGLLTHMSTADNPLNFRISIQGYEASNSQPGGGSVNLAAPAGGWAPALPAYLAALAPLPGSDIVMLRYLDNDGVPVTGIAADSVTVDSAKWSVLERDGVTVPTLFGVSDCTYSDIFQASAINSGAGQISSGAGGVATSVANFASRYSASPAGQTMVYRAEAIAYYVATGAGGGPSLQRTRFLTTVGGPITTFTEELVEGIESMQLVYGLDQGTVDALTGNIATFRTAAQLGAALANENDWRRVGQVKVGMVAVSPQPAAVEQSIQPLSALGTVFVAPNDGNYRSTYESAVALRNRLYGN